AATYLCPAIFPWVDTGPATEESGMFVMKMVGVLYLLIFIFDLIIVCGMHNMTGATTFFMFLFLFAIIGVLLAISRKPQNRNTLMFMTPGLPFVPAIAITVNIYLILKLSILTLVRFTIWMTLGFIMYFYYGIKNSTLEEGTESDQNIELTVTDIEKPKFNEQPQYTQTLDQNIYSQNQINYEWDPNVSWEQNTWSQSPMENQWSQPNSQQYQVEQQYNIQTNNTKSVINKTSSSSRPIPPRPPSRPVPPRPSPVDPSPQSPASSSLFISESAFPTWDD
ncbi:hypothetical protein AMK59_2319, partial [Oryctes borbonicus]